VTRRLGGNPEAIETELAGTFLNGGCIVAKKKAAPKKKAAKKKAAPKKKAAKKKAAPKKKKKAAKKKR